MGLFSCGNTRNYLKGFGYGTIALPREGIKPLLMMIRNGDRLTPLGPLAVTFQPGGAPLPVAARNISAPVSGARSRKIDVSLGLNVLGTVIGALAGSSLGLKAAYKNASKVEFEFGDVTEEKVDINALDSYLSNAPVAGGAGNFVKQALEKDEVYVIVSTLDAKKISVVASGENNASIGLDIPVIQQIVGGNIAVAGSGTSNSKVTYASNTTPLSFGLQVMRLVFDKGKYTTLKTVGPGNAAALTGDQSAATSGLLGPGLRAEF